MSTTTQIFVSSSPEEPTRNWLRGSLEQLVMQRQRYELARRSTGVAAMQTKHARTVARLDEEIDGHRRALAACDPAVSLASRPCIDLDVDACELSGQYDKVRPARFNWEGLRARVPAAIWLTMLIALVVGFAGTSLGIVFEPATAQAAPASPNR